MEKKNTMIVAIVAIVVLLLAVVGGLYATGNLGGGGGNENYQVSFVDGDNVISTVDVDKNSYVKEPAAPTKDGYIFAGWYADSAFTKAFDFKNTKITSDTKIYAKFVSEDEKFTVSFNSNGGSSVASQTVNAGEKAVKPADPTKANSIFAGWYCDAALTEAYDFNTPVLSNITLYAKWTAESGTFTVTFNSNGGSAVPSQVVKAGEKAVKPSNPTKSGFTFSGWYSDAALTTQYNFNSAVTANITLYAKWTTSGGGGGGYVPPSEYTITFDANAVDITVSPSSIPVKSGDTISNLPEVTRPGFAFLGWNTKSDGSGTVFTSTTPVTSSYTVYAQWSKNGIVEKPSGDGNTTAEVTTINEELAKDLVNNADGNTIVFDASFENTDSVKISKNNISTLNSAMTKEGSSVNSLTFKTNDGSVTLNSTAVSSLASSDKENIVIEVKDAKNDIVDDKLKAAVGDNPVFEISITDGNAEINLANGSELTITVPYDENSIDPKNCKVFYVKDDGTIAEAYDVEVNDIAKTITFTTGHNSYYAILPPEGLLNYTLVTANAWLRDAKLDSLFILEQDKSDPNKIKLIIDVSKMFSNNNSLQTVNSEAFDNFLTNFGNFVELIFKDSSLTLSVEGLQDRNVLSNGALKDDAIVQFVYDLIDNAFYTISNMSANSNDEYSFKEIIGTLDGTEFTLNMVFVDRSDSTDTNYIQEIKNFASKIDEHLEIAHVDSSLVIKFKAPNALLNYAANMYESGKTYESLEDKEGLIAAFDKMAVNNILTKMSTAVLDENNVVGSQQHAVNRVLGILLSNEAFINKVLSEVTSVKLDDSSGNSIDLLKQDANFTPSNNGSDNWQKFINTLVDMLSEEAKSATPGSYKQTDGTYKVPVTITLDMKDELKLTNTTNMDIVIIMDIFPSEEKSPVELTVEKANKWLKDSNLDGLFNFKFNSVTGDVTIMIDADYVFGNNNELGNITPGAFDGFLTNIGKFINKNFSDSTLSLKIDNNTQTVLDNGSLSGDGLKGLVFGLLDDFFVNITKMESTAGNIYEFKTINATLDGKSFNIMINFTGDRMDEIITFAGKINENLELTYNASANDLTVKVTAPNALLNYAANMYESGKTYESLEDKEGLIAAFDKMAVNNILTKMSTAVLDENNVVGSQQHAVNRVLGILLSNEAFINKVLSEVTSVKLDDSSGNSIDLLKQDANFTPSNNGSDNWQKFINTLVDMLSEEAKSATPGSYKQTDGTYKVPVTITLDLQKELSIAPLDVQITVILNIFPEVNP